MIKENGKEMMDEISIRLDERLEYLKRDINLLIRNMSNIKDSVLQLNGEVEKIQKTRNN